MNPPPLARFGRASFQGAAYVFVRSGSSWSQQQEVTANDGAASDRFGYAVAVSGDTAIVGADGKASNQGAAYVFVRSGSSWSQQQEVTASDGAASDRFGDAVAVSGDTAIVGADGKASNQGAAYVLVLQGMSNGAACSGAANCQSGSCVDGVCCMVTACAAADDCHNPGTCQPATGVCSNPPKTGWHDVLERHLPRRVCTPAKDAGADSGGAGGAGGESSATAGSSASSTSGAGGTGGTGSKAPDGASDLSCRSAARGTEASARAAWLGVIALLALCRRQPKDKTSHG